MHIVKVSPLHWLLMFSGYNTNLQSDISTDIHWCLIYRIWEGLNVLGVCINHVQSQINSAHAFSRSDNNRSSCTCLPEKIRYERYPDWRTVLHHYNCINYSPSSARCCSWALSSAWQLGSAIFARPECECPSNNEKNTIRPLCPINRNRSAVRFCLFSYNIPGSRTDLYHCAFGELDRTGNT